MDIQHKVFYGESGNFTNARRIDNAVNQILEQANTWINQHQSRISLVDTNLSVTPYTTHFVVWYSLNEGVDALDGEQPYGE